MSWHCAEIRHPAFGINFDPSHLHWQQVDPVTFLEGHAEHIVHVHMKDTARRLNGRNGILASHLPFGDGRKSQITFFSWSSASSLSLIPKRPP